MTTLDDLKALDARLDEISRFLGNARPKAGVEMHARLHKIKIEFDDRADAGEDITELNDALLVLLERLLNEVFDVTP